MSFPSQIARKLPSSVTKVFGRKGLAFGALIMEWPDIVGAEVAGWCIPVKLTFARGQKDRGTLVLDVFGAHGLELQHRAPAIIERVNRFMGYGAVARLTFIRAERRAPKRKRAPAHRLTPTQEKSVQDTARPIEDGDLRAALEKFGRSLTSDARSA